MKRNASRPERGNVQACLERTMSIHRIAVACPAFLQGAIRRRPA